MQLNKNFKSKRLKKKKKPECSSVEYHLSQKHSPLLYSVPPSFKMLIFKNIFRLIVTFSIKLWQIQKSTLDFLIFFFVQSTSVKHDDRTVLQFLFFPSISNREVLTLLTKKKACMPLSSFKYYFHLSHNFFQLLTNYHVYFTVLL